MFKRGIAMRKIMRNRLVENVFSLLILQGSNYIFPLITFPYLVRILGTDNYGILVFCVAIMQFLNIFVDYGFNISGTRDISINKHNKEKVNDIFNVIMTIKIALTLFVGIVFYIVVESFSFFYGNKVAFLLSFLILFGNTFFPIWLYQGLEKMKYITYFTIISKILVTLLIFIFIRDSDDINIAVFFQTLYYIIPGIFSFFFVRMKFNIDYKIIKDIHKITHELVKGKHIFMTNLWINFYSQGPLIILGFISGNNATGNYSIGQKIMGAFNGLSQPVIQAVYPYLCELYESKKNFFFLFKKKLLFLSCLFSILIALLLYIFSSQLSQIVIGEYNAQITQLIRVFSIITFLSIMNTIMARIMYSMDLQKNLNRSYSIAATVFIILSVPLTIWIHEYGMALTVIFAESIVFILNIRNMITTNITSVALNEN